MYAPALNINIRNLIFSNYYLKMTFPTLISLIDILNDESKCIEWLIENHIVDILDKCERCNDDIRLSGTTYHCRSRNCRKQFSLFRRSFFSQSKLNCNEILLIGYLWLGGSRYTQIQRYTGHSSATIGSYMHYYRQLIISALDDENNMIGGEGIIVEIDESKFGKRKQNRGHHVEAFGY